MYAWLKYGLTIRGFIHDLTTIDVIWNSSEGASTLPRTICILRVLTTARV